MTRSLVASALTALTLCLAAPTANAATLGVLTHVYQNNTDLVTGEKFVRINDDPSFNFLDAFDLSAFSGNTIVSLSLQLVFSQAGNAANRMWNVAVDGSNGASMTDDLTAQLTSRPSPLTLFLDASTDSAGISAFGQSLAANALSFRFFETTDGADAFRLNSAQLTVTGYENTRSASVSAVPLPAAGLMLMAGIGGLAALRRRKAR